MANNQTPRYDLTDDDRKATTMCHEEEIWKGLYAHTLDGHVEETLTLTREGVALGLQPLDMLFEALIPALQEVGRRFELGEFFVPEMLASATAIQGALNVLRPLMDQSGAQSLGTVLMLTVKGDVHDIGKGLCCIMLEGAGFTVVDLGVNVSPETLIAAVRRHSPQIVGMSAFLTTTMPMFKTSIQALEQAGLRDRVKVIIGGAPVTQDYADKMGADGYAPDASATVRLARRLLAETVAGGFGAGEAVAGTLPAA